jgi:metacaspase-1
MARALSIHIGVNTPAGRMAAFPLRQSEDVTWRMAGLANQAGYGSLLVMRGESATRQSVHHALTSAAGMLVDGDALLVTFSGHGTQERDLNKDEWGGIDEGWCLADGVLLDDKLAGYWRLFEPGVRIVVVSESCYSGGMDRDDKGAWDDLFHPQRTGIHNLPPVYRGQAESVADHSRSCIGEPPKESLGIRASVLLLTASRKEQVSCEGLFSQHLLAVWDNGAFQGSYCALHRAVRDRVLTAGAFQEPQILMLGSGDLGFPLERAFHVDHDASGRGIVYR